MEGHDGVVLVVFPFEQGGQLLALHLLLEGVVVFLHFGIKALVPFFQGQVDQLQGVVIQPFQFGVLLGFVLELFDALEHFLGILRLIPKAGLGSLFFQLLHFLGAGLQVQRAPQLHEFRFYIGQIGSQFF